MGRLSRLLASSYDEIYNAQAALGTLKGRSVDLTERVLHSLPSKGRLYKLIKVLTTI